MRRRAKTTKAKVNAKPPVARKSPKDEDSRVRDLEKRLAESLGREKATGEILQEKTRVLTQSHAQLAHALNQQTATAEILSVISRSPTDMQPVFDAIVKNAVHLLNAYSAAVMRLRGDELHLAAFTTTGGTGDEVLTMAFPRPLNTAGFLRVAVTSRVPCAIADIETVSDLSEIHIEREIARARGYRGVLVVPMLHDGAVVGTLSVTRREPGPFSEGEIGLLQTFADQAVIAIENVRLFKELEARNRDLTATSEILRVISSSPTDVQPVFDAIVASAVRLFAAPYSALFRLQDDQLHLVALTGGPAAEAEVILTSIFPRRIDQAGLLGRAVSERQPVQTADLFRDPRVGPRAAEAARIIGYQSFLHVPLLRDGNPMGVLTVGKRETGLFTPAQIELLKTFADQAVIAIENARLFKELEARTGELTQSVEQLTALGEISRALSSTLDVDTVLSTIVSRAKQLAGTDACTVYEYDERTEEFVMRATHDLDESVATALRRAPIRRGDGAVGRVAVTREPVQIPDIALEGAYHGAFLDLLLQSGTRALLAMPLLHEDHLVGGLTVNKKTPGEFSPEAIELLKTFAAQSALAIQNARLFREIADKSQQLEAASRHKSEFLANMSHELRTPLNAIIGFSEVLTERMFGELNEKQDEYLKDIYASGQHLLSLINDILDLSKIEAGRMELELADFDLPSAIDNALILVRERASRRGITLGHSVDERLGSIRGDERKVKQVLLNLLSNALKFTPEGGRIDVHAVPQDGVVEIAVADTGVGIAPEDQDAVFEEFRQVGTADKKVEGTGLGLALSRKFIELHGGRIWVESEVGKGSTFTFSLPVGHGA